MAVSDIRAHTRIASVYSHLAAAVASAAEDNQMIVAATVTADPSSSSIFPADNGSPAHIAALRACRDELRAFINEVNCNPILLRLAWHDAGTYDNRVPAAQWPKCGGANGSIRFAPELAHGANAGLAKAVNYLRAFNTKYPAISWADLIQLAGATAIEAAGGPRVPMRYGRVDVASAEQCAREGNLPGAEPPFADAAPDAAQHLRNVFYRMGFDDREIVALSGAHTIGRAFKERSGVTEHGYGEKNATAFTCPVHRARADGQAGVGMPGGASWTKQWLKFDNSYFQKEYLDPAVGKQLLWLSTDRALHEDAGFRPHFERYARDQAAFFADFAAAMAKLSERGSKFEPAEGVRIE